MESKIEVEENLQDHEFDVNLLPVEMLIEIFSYLKHNERLKAALVCDRWFDVARSHRFDLPLKKVYGCDCDEFINIFKEGSKSLPFQCIELEINCIDEAPQIELNQLNDIVKQYGHVKIVPKVNEDAAGFLQFIKILPEMLKTIIWEFYAPSDFHQHWLDICNAVQSKNIKVVIHGTFINDYPLNKKILSTLIYEASVKNFCIEKLIVDPMILKEFEQKRLVELLKTLKFAELMASEPEDFIFFNQFLSPSVTHFTLRTYDDYNTRNILELLPNLSNVQQIKIEIWISFIPLSFTSTKLNFPKLKKFEFTARRNVLLEYESFKRFVESSPNLEEITLYIHNYGYSQEQSLILIENICLFCPFLKKLSIKDILYNARGNFQSHYLRALNKLQHLESLQMINCEFETNLLNGLQLNALKELKISFESMDPEGARMLIKAFPNLEKVTLTQLKFKDIKQMDTNTVKVLSELQNLKYIYLSFCPEGSTEAYTNILKENHPDIKVDIQEYYRR